jgi:hypothetical protein
MHNSRRREDYNSVELDRLFEVDEWDSRERGQREHHQAYFPKECPQYSRRTSFLMYRTLRMLKDALLAKEGKFPRMTRRVLEAMISSRKRKIIELT